MSAPLSSSSSFLGAVRARGPGVRTSAARGVIVAAIFLASDASALLSENFVFVGTPENAQNVSIGWTPDPIVFGKTTSLPTGTGGPGDTADSRHAATANAPTETLRAEARLHAFSDDGWSYAAKTQSFFRKEVYVDPASSGLALGDPITLQVSILLDGRSEVGRVQSGLPTVIQSSIRSLTSVDSSARYMIEDLSDVVCGEGCRPRELARFGYGGRLLYDFSGDATSASRTYALRSSWSASGNVSGSVPGANVTDDLSGPVPAGPPGFEDYDFTTGRINLSIGTRVGHTLRVDADLDVFVQALGRDISADAAGDFSTTFDAEVTTAVQGVILQGVTLGVYVPEPGTGALLLAGLGLLGVRARRRP